MLDFRLRDTHPIQLPIDVLSTQRQRFRGRTTLLGKLMHETCVVPCNIHHSDHDDLIVFDHKMNDVGESFDQAGAETIDGYREEPWVLQDTINRGDVFCQELIAQSDLLLGLPKRCF